MTFAPGTTAPVVSLTVPKIVPVSTCAHTTEAQDSRTANINSLPNHSGWVLSLINNLPYAEIGTQQAVSIRPPAELRRYDYVVIGSSHLLPGANIRIKREYCQDIFR